MALLLTSIPMDRNFRYSVVLLLLRLRLLLLLFLFFLCVCLFASCFLEYCRTQLLLMLITADGCAASGAAMLLQLLFLFHSDCSKCHIRHGHHTPVYTVYTVFYSVIQTNAFLPSRCKHSAMARESTHTHTHLIILLIGK